MISILLGVLDQLVVHGQVMDKTSHEKTTAFSSHHFSFFEVISVL